MQTSTRISRRQFLKKSGKWMLGAGIPFLTGSYSFAIERNWLEVAEFKISLPRLPEPFQGTRIVHFSDLHVGFYFEPDDLQEVVERIMQAKPDLILFTGDLIDHEVQIAADCVPFLSKLTAPLGKFAVLGNHDFDGEKVAEALKKSGFVVLRNANRFIMKGNERLAIAGVEDLLSGMPDLHLALEGIPENTCTILLSHCPDYADELPEGRVDLQLSGHSHGGQIRFPLVGHVITPPGAKKYVDGLYRLPSGTRLYVSRGIGTTFLPFRFLCRPQLSIMELATTE